MINLSLVLLTDSFLTLWTKIDLKLYLSKQKQISSTLKNRNFRRETGPWIWFFVKDRFGPERQKKGRRSIQENSFYMFC